ncbi:MAG: GPW/gp25 family protein [Methylococcaceae bacterium]|nr:GPW/gp25 family protein [Methylococcaceae bacterium]
MIRRDYAFPFRLDPASGQAMQTGYASHVEQMIRQVLLTSPGERADLPEFGCGLRRLIFAPHSQALDATTQILVMQALDKWLAGQIQVQSVSVLSPEDTGYDPAQLSIRIEYQLIETRTNHQLQVKVN